MSGDDRFLHRWSKRKLDPAIAAPPGADEAKIEAAPAAEEAPFDLSTLPSFEELTGDSDLSVFLQAGVPEALRNAAMRKVWALDPLITAYRGPVDYAWDFNDPTSMPGFGPLDASITFQPGLERLSDGTEAGPQPGPAAQISAASDEPEALDSTNDTETKKLDEETEFLARSVNSHMPEMRDQHIDKTDENHLKTVDESSQNAPPSTPRKRHGGAMPV